MVEGLPFFLWGGGARYEALVPSALKHRKELVSEILSGFRDTS